MTDREPPKIEFPCENYPIKVIGDAADDFSELVIEIMNRHVDDFDDSTLSIQPSSNGRYCSVRVFIMAKDITQLQSIHEDLRATGRVHMVL